MTQVDFPRWLREQLRGRTQGQVAQYVGVAASTVNRWVMGVSEPEGPNIRSLAAYLKVPQAEIERRLAPRALRVSPRSPTSDSSLQSATIARPNVVLGDAGRARPVYRWGMAGDPRDSESGPEPAFWTDVPAGIRECLGRHAFGVEIAGRSMVNRDILPGDVVWIDPDKPYGPGDIVLARLFGADDEDLGMVIKVFGATRNGIGLSSDGEEDCEPVLCARYQVIGPKVGKMRYEVG